MYGELGSIKEIVALSPQETLDSAAALLVQLGYEVTMREDTSLTATRRKREGVFGHSLQNVTVAALPQPEGGVKVELRGTDREGVQERQEEWTGWANGLPKLGQEEGRERATPETTGTQAAKTRADEPLQETTRSSEAGSGLSREGEGEVPGHAYEPEIPEAARDGEEGRTPPPESQRWATVASWDQEQRVAPGKQEAEPSPAQDDPSSGDTKFSVDDREGRDEAANDASIPKVVEAESLRLVNERGEPRVVIGLRGDSPCLEFKGADRDYRFLLQIDSKDGLPKLVVFDDSGVNDVPKGAIQASATPQTSVEHGAPVTDTPAKRGYTVGDTAVLSTGDRLTLHSYKSPVPPPGHKKQKTGYEFLVLDVEVCTSSNSEGLEYINPFNFVLQMPDNTRLKPEEQHAERELEHIDLLPDDPVRGLIFFQVPEEENPKAVIFSQTVVGGVQMVKWSV